MPDSFSPEQQHALRNQIAIVIGYCEILLDDTAPGTPLHADLTEMLKAATTAMQMIRHDEAGT